MDILSRHSLAGSGRPPPAEGCGTGATAEAESHARRLSRDLNLTRLMLRWSRGAPQFLTHPALRRPPQSSAPCFGLRRGLLRGGRNVSEVSITPRRTRTRELLIHAARTFRRRMVQVVRIPSRHQRICRVPPADRPAASPSRRSKMRAPASRSSARMLTSAIGLLRPVICRPEPRSLRVAKSR
jgi:hypothetical protein